MEIDERRPVVVNDKCKFLPFHINTIMPSLIQSMTGRSQEKARRFLGFRLVCKTWNHLIYQWGITTLADYVLNKYIPEYLAHGKAITDAIARGLQDNMKKVNTAINDIIAALQS